MKRLSTIALTVAALLINGCAHTSGLPRFDQTFLTASSPAGPKKESI